MVAVMSEPEAEHPRIVAPGQIMVTVVLDIKARTVRVTGPADKFVQLKVLMQAMTQTVAAIDALRTARFRVNGPKG